MTETLPLVLIVDDSLDTRAIASALLSRNGFRTLEADSAWTAEQLISAHRPDVLLLDLRMPLKSGLHLLRDIAPARSKTNMRVIIYSSFADLYQKELTALGITDIIDKSATPQEFMDAFKAALGGGGSSETGAEVTVE